MCDTFVVLNNVTADKSVIFAKNSDREPNEPQIVLAIPPKNHGIGEKLRCTYIEVEQSAHTNGVLLSKPSWIWGAEIGANEYGVVIGNEAVFTKEKQGPPALLGMDILRLALERCDSAENAVEMIIHMTEKYGQGGKCGYTQNLRYDNSYIVSDYNNSYVVETVGRFWAVEEITDIRSISNGLTIKEKFSKCHPELIANAIKKGWHREGEKFSLMQSYSDKLYSHFTHSEERHRTTEKLLRENSGNININHVKKILRNHNAEGCEFKSGSMRSICMHAGGLVSSQTTGSMIVELMENRTNIWVTGSSLPCISLYKPVWLLDYSKPLFTEGQEKQAQEFWRIRELLNRRLIDNSIENLEEFKSQRDKLEAEFEAMSKTSLNDEDKIKTMEYAFKRDDELYRFVLGRGSSVTAKIKGNPYFKHYWGKLNKKYYLDMGNN